jgi:hypothetical protein
VCIDKRQVEQMTEKFLPPFYHLPLKQITWQHLVWSVHNTFTLLQSNTVTGFILWCGSMLMVPQQVHLHGHLLREKHPGCPPIW